MTWFHWVLFTWLVLNALGHVARIGKKIDVTHQYAIVQVVRNALFLWGGYTYFL